MTADKLLSGTEAELEIHAELPHSKKYRKEMFRLLGCETVTSQEPELLKQQPS